MGNLKLIFFQQENNTSRATDLGRAFLYMQLCFSPVQKSHCYFGIHIYKIFFLYTDPSSFFWGICSIALQNFLTSSHFSWQSQDKIYFICTSSHYNIYA